MARLNVNNDNAAAMRDYNHAAKTFTSESGYALAPYSAFLFHVVIKFNTISETVANSKPLLDTRALAVLVSQSELPAVGFQTETLNQYNKKTLIKKKVEYDPLKLSFRDDIGQKIRTMWDRYNFHYNADFQRSNTAWNSTSPYHATPEQRWGLNSPGTRSAESQRFIDKIEIYSMGGGTAHVSTLLNPIISKASFDDHDYSEGNKTLAINFDIEYEGVQYSAELDTNDIVAFGPDNQQYYDQTNGNLGQRDLDRGSSVAGVVRTVDDLINRVDRTFDVIKNIDSLTDFLYFTGNERTARQIDTISGKVNEQKQKRFSEPQYVNFKNRVAESSTNSPKAYNFPDVNTFLSPNTQNSRSLDEETRSVSQSPSAEQIVYNQPATANSLNRSRQNQIPTATQLNIRYSTSSGNQQNLADSFVSGIGRSASVSSNGVNVSSVAAASGATSTLSAPTNSAILINPKVPPNLSPAELQLFARLYPALPSTDPRTNEPPYV